MSKGNSYRSRLAALVLLFAAPLFAAEQNEAPVHIEADSMQYDMNRGISHYRGNVRVSRAGFLLTGDHVVVQQHKKEINSIEVTGAPAQYTQQNEDGSSITASSMQMLYDAAQNRLVLTGDAELQQPGQSVKSQKITFDTVNKVVVAGNGEPNERVNITITPEKRDTP